MTAYYNEIDPFAAAWLENLIRANLIAPGVVDTRSIEDVRPDELNDFTQCHFFAGIGLWSYSFRLAGWSDDRPVWSGSCPCQPFSAAGKRGAFDDERHLWPAFHHLISECRPVAVFGEQVASKDGLAWIDLVQSDMEGSGYAFGAGDLCAAGFGAPHVRQRLVFAAFRVGNPNNTLLEGHRELGRINDAQGRETTHGHAGASNMVKSLADTAGTGLQRSTGRVHESRRSGGGEIGWSHAYIDPWRDTDWIFCRDDKWRPIEPGTFPLVNGYPARVGVLRAYGNAIVPPKIAAFIEAAMEWKP